MNVALIDPYVVEVLKSNNWFEDRKINIDSVIQQLEGEGYHCFEYAREVLESLNGVSISTEPVDGYMGAQFVIDAIEGGNGEYDRLEQEIAGERLFPIGHNPLNLFMLGKVKTCTAGVLASFA